MAEFSDDQARTLLGAQALLDKLLKSPKTRMETERLIKQHYPETTITDDIAAPYMSKIDSLEKKLDSFLKKNSDDADESRFQNQLNQLRSDRGYTDEGLDKIKKLMVEKSIPDAIVAADHYEKLNPPKAQEPSTFTPSSWGFGKKTDDADLKLLFEDEDAWAEQEANRAWAEETAKKGQIIS